jgi:hypothetical protein
MHSKHVSPGEHECTAAGGQRHCQQAQGPLYGACHGPTGPVSFGAPSLALTPSSIQTCAVQKVSAAKTIAIKQCISHLTRSIMRCGVAAAAVGVLAAAQQACAFVAPSSVAHSASQTCPSRVSAQRPDQCVARCVPLHSRQSLHHLEHHKLLLVKSLCAVRGPAVCVCGSAVHSSPTLHAFAATTDGSAHV